MTATLPLPVTHNRIAQHLPTAAPLPATPEARRQAWADALFAAAMFYQSRLVHPNVAIAENAARAIFDLEKTRLRHDRDLAGTTAPVPPAPGPPPPAVEAESADDRLIVACDEIIYDLYEQHRATLKPQTPDEAAAVREFQQTAQYAKVVGTFQKLFREDRDVELPPRGADAFAVTYFLRRYRESPGDDLDGTARRR